MKKISWPDGIPFVQNSSVTLQYDPVVKFLAKDVEHSDLVDLHASGIIILKLPESSIVTGTNTIFNPHGDVSAFSVRWTSEQGSVHEIGIKANFSLTSQDANKVPYNIWCSSNHIKVLLVDEDQE